MPPKPQAQHRGPTFVLQPRGPWGPSGHPFSVGSLQSTPGRRSRWVPLHLGSCPCVGSGGSGTAPEEGSDGLTLVRMAGSLAMPHCSSKPQFLHL